MDPYAIRLDDPVHKRLCDLVQDVCLAALADNSLPSVSANWPSISAALPQSIHDGRKDVAKALLENGTQLTKRMLGLLCTWAKDASSQQIFLVMLDYLYDIAGLEAIIKENGRGSPILLAIMCHNLPYLKWVLEHGANPNPIDPSIHHYDRFTTRPLAYAITQGTVECIEILIEHGAEVDDFLRLAACREYQDRFDIVQCLLDQGADINGCGSFDKDVSRQFYQPSPFLFSTALFSATSRRDVKMVKFLVAIGADPTRGDGDPSTSEKFGSSPLDWLRGNRLQRKPGAKRGADLRKELAKALLGEGGGRKEVGKKVAVEEGEGEEAMTAEEEEIEKEETSEERPRKKLRRLRV